MFERIVVIVDGSETSKYAIGAGITVALEDASLITFGVTIDPALTEDGVGGTCFTELARQMSQGMLDDALAEAQRRGLQGSTGAVLIDEPARGVVALACEQRAGLIVLGVKPRIGLLRPFMRSLAEEVLRETMIPLCVVRRRTRGKLTYRRILVPIVADDLSEIAVRYAVTLARHLRSTILFCSVEPSAKERGLALALDRAKSYAGTEGVPADELLLPLRNGIPNAIVRSAEVHSCDSIVMAAHVRAGLPRLIEGSVTEAVIYSSDVPVVIVRAPSPA